MMKYGLTKHSRKENLTKDDIPTIFEPLIDTVQAISPTSNTLKIAKFKETVSIVALAKKNKPKSLLGTYDQPVQVPISVASPFIRSKVCSFTRSSNGKNHAEWNCGYHEVITLNQVIVTLVHVYQDIIKLTTRAN